MRKEEELKRKLTRRLKEAATDSCFWATVKEVNVSERTCTVSDGVVDYEEVLLYSVIQNEKGLCVFPSKNSKVIVSRVAGSDTLFVEMFSKIDQVSITIEDSEFDFCKDGYSINRSSSGLKKTLEKLCDAICKLTVTTAMGPSGTPINAAEFTAIKMDLKNYLKR